MSSDANSKKMGLVGLTVLVAVNMMGSGIIMLPASLAQVGTISLLSWVITALGAMCIAYTFAKCGAICKRSGGMSAYSEEAHGKSSFFDCVLHLLCLPCYQLCCNRSFSGGLYQTVHAMA